MTMPTMRCAGCGAEVGMDDPGFSEWWVEHGKCLVVKYGEPPSEIDQTVKAIVTRKPPEVES